MPGLPAAAILRLAREVWAFNTRVGLTGWLRFAAGRFEQVVEGPCDIVLPLSSRILTDPRHGAITIAGFGPIPERRCRSWTLEGFETGLDETGDAAPHPVDPRFLTRSPIIDSAPGRLLKRAAARPGTILSVS